jgi:hypothetical protein
MRLKDIDLLRASESLFIFNETEGILIRKIDVPKTLCKKGDIVGSLDSKGYLRVSIKGIAYLVHRIIYLMNHRQLPVFIDHIDRNKTNNKLSNLREITVAQNTQNRKKPRNNTSGVKGVNFLKSINKWQARIMKDGKRISLGNYIRLEDAESAYNKACVKYHGKYACPNNAGKK